MSSQPTPQIAPEHILFTLNAYQQSHALKGAIELELFTHIADGAKTAAEIAKRCQANERGVRILCDYLTVIGFLTKADGTYGLDSGIRYVSQQASPAYLGSAADFLLNDWQMANYRNVAGMVRKGSTLEGSRRYGPGKSGVGRLRAQHGTHVRPSAQVVAAASGIRGKR